MAGDDRGNGQRDGHLGLVRSVQDAANDIVEAATKIGQAYRLNSHEVMVASAVALACMAAGEEGADDRSKAVEMVTGIIGRTTAALGEADDD